MDWVEGFGMSEGFKGVLTWLWSISEARSGLERTAKLLLVEGALEEGEGFLPVVEGF